MFTGCLVLTCHRACSQSTSCLRVCTSALSRRRAAPGVMSRLHPGVRHRAQGQARGRRSVRSCSLHECRMACVSLEAENTLRRRTWEPVPSGARLGVLHSRPLRSRARSSTRQSWRSCPLRKTRRNAGSTSTTGCQKRPKVRGFVSVDLAS